MILGFTFNDAIGIGSIINYVLVIIVFVAGYFAIRGTKKDMLLKFQQNTISFQQDTIDAFEARVRLCESEITDLKAKNFYMEHQFEIVTSALKQHGIHITVTGDLVTITDERGNSTSGRVPRMKKNDTADEAK